MRSLSIKVGRRLPVVVGVILVVGLVGFALAGIPGEDGRIKGCYKKSGGALRVIDEYAKCAKDETTLFWSQVGPAGPEGTPGTEGPMGPPGPAFAYYTDHDWMLDDDLANDMLVISTTEHTTVMSLSLPEIGEGQGYLGTSTFTLVNEGPVDADLVCSVGNQMGHELFLPVDDRTDLGGPGVWGSNTRTYTLSGMSTGLVRLSCQLTGWAGVGDSPTVGVRRASLDATFIDVLDDQSG